MKITIEIKLKMLASSIVVGLHVYDELKPIYIYIVGPPPKKFLNRYKKNQKNNNNKKSEHPP